MLLIDQLLRKGIIIMKTIAILGTGNIAQTMAIDMKLQGHIVRLFAPEHLEYRIHNLIENRVLESTGELVGRAELDLVTTDIDAAVQGADYICICVPGYRHEEFGKLLKGHTTKDQVVFTFNACLASLVLKNIWGDSEDCPVFVDTDLPPFSTRVVAPGKIRLFERHLGGIAFFPASAAEKYFDEIVRDFYAFPRLYKDVLECALCLINPVVHPGACLVNLSNIEKPDTNFFLYEHGFTPSGIKIDLLLNEERQKLAAALGYEIHALEDFAGVSGKMTWEALYAMGHGCHALTSIAGPNDIYDRYLTEDVPVDLVCWSSLAGLVGVPYPVTNALITLVGVVHGEDWFAKGRSAEKLGLTGKTANQIINYVRTGIFKMC